MTTGIVSEICLGTLISSKNDILIYPINVLVHVTERTIYGEINPYGCTVSTGNGAWVTAANAKFSFLSEPLPYKYQDLTREDKVKLIKNFYIYSKENLGTLNDKFGIFEND